MNYGVFVKLEEGVEGLIHNSELSWSDRNIEPNKILSPSQKIKVKIVNIDKDAKEFRYLIEKLWKILGKK